MYVIVVRLDPSSPESAVPAQGVACHDIRDPKQRSEVLVRKGSLLSAADVLELMRRDVAEFHLAVPEPGDLPEDEAVQRLGVAVAGPGVRVESAHFGQVTLTCDARGMLRLDAARLERVNEQDGVLVLTAEAERPVETETPVGVVKCAPLFLSPSVLQAVEAIRSESGPVIEVQGFRPHRAAFVAPRDRLRGNAFERAAASLSTALDWYGSSLAVVIPAETALDSLAAGFRQALAEGAELILAAGATGTDPADIVFEALRRAGGTVDQIGIPARARHGLLDRPARGASGARARFVRVVRATWRTRPAFATRAVRRDTRSSLVATHRERRAAGGWTVADCAVSHEQGRRLIARGVPGSASVLG